MPRRADDPERDRRPPPPPDRRFRIVRFLGSGAEGRVFLAKDRQLGGLPVALKILDRRSRDAAALRERLALLCRLEHPNIARVVDYHVDPRPGRSWIAREFVRGEDLTAFARRTEVEGPALASLLRGLASALVQYHGRGIAHGDVRPANILCFPTPEGPMLKLIDGGIPAAGPAIRGTDGADARRQDLSFAGAACYQALTGQAPDRRRRPRALNPAIPPWLDRLILKLLVPAPPDGIGNAETFLEEVLRIARRPGRSGRALPFSKPPLVGREEDWRALQWGLDRMLSRDAAPEPILLSGPAGIGKTALLRELQVHARSRGADVYLARSPAEGALPYDPILQITQSIAARHGWHDPLLTERPETPAALTRLFVRVVRRAARSSPCVLAVDDLHQVSLRTRDAMAAALPLLRRAPVLVVLAGRGAEPSPLERPHVRPRALEPLTPEAVAELLRAGFGLTPQDALVRRVHERTGGVPGLALALLEVLRDRLQAQGPVLRLGPGQRLPRPEELQSGAREAVGRLDRRELRAARALSAHPGFLKEPVALAVLADAEGLSLLSALVHKGALERTGLHTFEWTSAVLRQTLYARLTARERRRVHGRFARAGREHFGPRTLGAALFLAYHQARSGRPDRAFAPALHAARLLERVMRHREAVDFYRLALRLADPRDATLQARLCRFLAGACLKAGLNRLGRRTARELIRLRRRLADALPAVHFVRAENGAAAAVAFIDSILASRLRRSPGALALLHAQRSQALALLGRLDAAERAAARAEVYLAETRDRAVAADTALIQGGSLFLRGHLRAACARLMRGLRLARALRDPLREARLCDNLSMALRARFDLRRARRFTERALRIRIRHGLVPESAISRSVLGGILTDLGDYAQARTELLRAREAFERYGDADRTPATAYALGTVDLRCGEHVTALEWFEKAVRESASNPRIGFAQAARAGIALAHLQTGHARLAAEALRQAGACPRRRTESLLTWLHVHALHALSNGDRGRVRRLLARAERILGGTENRFFGLQFLLVRSELSLAEGRTDDALERAEDAAWSAGLHGARPLRAEALLLGAEARLRRGEAAAARRLLQELRPVLDGVPQPSLRIRWTLLKAGLPGPPSESIRLGHHAYRLAAENGLEPLRRRAALVLARAYEAREDYPSALRFYKEVRDHADSRPA